MLQVGLLGYNGRMGKLIAEAISETKSVRLSSVFVRNREEGIKNTDVYVTGDWGEFLNRCEVVIDFSSPFGTLDLLKVTLDCPRPLVIGTTGLSCETHSLMEQLSHKIPIVYATNTSRGVTLLNRLAFLASETLRDADIEIVEMHHHHKKDAPSGTAITLTECCAKARGLELDEVRISGREGNLGERDSKEIGVMSLRGGDIVGRHTVGFYCDGEYLEITHNATSRKTFAIGALKAAQWVINQSNGLYSMKDVLS